MTCGRKRRTIRTASSRSTDFGQCSQRLVERSREAEVEGPREVLPAAVEPPRRAELLRADEAEADAEVVADEVLAALAAREREVRGLAAHALSDESEQLRVLVVGMRADDEQAPVRSEPPQHAIHRVEPSGRRGSERVGGRRDGLLGPRRGRESEEGEARAEDEREAARAQLAALLLEALAHEGDRRGGGRAEQRREQTRLLLAAPSTAIRSARRVTVRREARDAESAARRNALAPPSEASAIAARATATPPVIERITLSKESGAPAPFLRAAGRRRAAGLRVRRAAPVEDFRAGALRRLVVVMSTTVLESSWSAMFVLVSVIFLRPLRRRGRYPPGCLSTPH